MAKNKLTIQNPKALLAEMYILIMGDETEDIDDVSDVYYNVSLQYFTRSKTNFHQRQLKLN